MLDKLLSDAGACLRASFPATSSQPPTDYPKPNTSQSPTRADSPAYSAAQRKHLQGLLRINHCGEVCAQALYRGQALSSLDEQEIKALEQAAQEEESHLNWCAHRLSELGAKPSLVNPLAYSFCYGMGSLVGAFSPRYGQAFIYETEDLVAEHLQKHLDQLSPEHLQEAAIFGQMLAEEKQHRDQALARQREQSPQSTNEQAKQPDKPDTPEFVRSGMRTLGRLMSAITYRI